MASTQQTRLPESLAFSPENHDSTVAGIGNEHETLGVGCYSVRSQELAGS